MQYEPNALQCVVETVAEASPSFHVVDSEEAAAALGAELEAVMLTTMERLLTLHHKANANFGRALVDLYAAVCG